MCAYPSHGLSDGLHHASYHPTLTRCLIQRHHDVIYCFLHQLCCLSYSIMGMRCLYEDNVWVYQLMHIVNQTQVDNHKA